jgi:hypothetical protein
MKEEIEFGQAMASIKSLLVKSHQTFTRKIEKSSLMTPGQILQTVSTLRSANEIAFRQILNECTRMEFPSLTQTVGQLRLNTECLISNILLIFEGDLEGLSAKITNREKKQSLNGEPGTSVENRDLLDFKFKPKNLLTAKNTPRNTIQRLSHLEDKNIERVEPEITIEAELNFGQSSEAESIDKAKKLFKSLERGEINWAGVSLIHDPFVLIELSQFITRDLMNNFEQNKVDLLKIADFGPLNMSVRSSSPNAHINSIQNSITDFYSRIHRLDKQPTELEFRDKQLKLEAQLLSNFDEKSRALWSKIIRSFFLSYRLFQETKNCDHVGVQFNGEETGHDKHENADSKLMSRIMDLQIELKKMTSYFDESNAKLSEAQNQIEVKEAAYKKTKLKYSDVKDQLQKQITIIKESTQKGSYYISKISELQKKEEEAGIRAVDIRRDFASVGSTFTEVMKFLSALKEKMMKDLIENETASVKVYKYIRQMIAFVQKWDYLKFDSFNDIFRKWTSESDQNSEKISTSLAEKSFSFSFGALEKLSQSPFTLSATIKIDGPFSIYSNQDGKYQLNSLSWAILPIKQSLESINDKGAAPKKKKRSKKFSISQNIHIFVWLKGNKFAKMINRLDEANSQAIDKFHQNFSVKDQQINQKSKVKHRRRSVGGTSEVRKRSNTNEQPHPLRKSKSLVNVTNPDVFKPLGYMNDGKPSKSENQILSQLNGAYSSQSIGKVMQQKENITSSNRITNSLLSSKRRGGVKSTLNAIPDIMISKFHKKSNPKQPNSLLSVPPSTIFQPEAIIPTKDRRVTLFYSRFDTKHMYNSKQIIQNCYSYTYQKQNLLESTQGLAIFREGEKSRHQSIKMNNLQSIIPEDDRELVFSRENSSSKTQIHRKYTKSIDHSSLVNNPNFGHRDFQKRHFHENISKRETAILLSKKREFPSKAHLDPIELSLRESRSHKFNGSSQYVSRDKDLCLSSRMLGCKPLIDHPRMNNNTLSQTKNPYIVHEKEGRQRILKREKEISFVPVTITTDYFNRQILKKRVGGIKGVSLSRREPVNIADLERRTEVNN